MLNGGEMLLKNYFWDIILNNGFFITALYCGDVVKVAFLGKKNILLSIVKIGVCSNFYIMMLW